MANAAELEMVKLDKNDRLKNLPRSKAEMAEFAYYHSLAAILYEGERDSLKIFGKGIIR